MNENPRPTSRMMTIMEGWPVNLPQATVPLLAEHFGEERSALSHLIRRMVERGFVKLDTSTGARLYGLSDTGSQWRAVHQPNKPSM